MARKISLPQVMARKGVKTGCQQPDIAFFAPEIAQKPLQPVILLIADRFAKNQRNLMYHSPLDNVLNSNKK
jgi:hypothetical protein